MVLRNIFICILVLIVLTQLGFSSASFSYEVDDLEGVDYVNMISGADEKLIDRVDITHVTVELSDKQLKWIIEYKDRPLDNDEVFEGAGNGSYVYRVTIDVGATLNGVDGHIWFNLMPTLQFNASKNESVATTVYVELVSGSNIVGKSFGLYNVNGNKLVYQMKVPRNLTLGSPSEKNIFLNLSSYLNQQGVDLVKEMLSYSQSMPGDSENENNNISNGASNQTGSLNQEIPNENPNENVNEPDVQDDQNLVIYGVVVLALAAVFALYFAKRGR